MNINRKDNILKRDYHEHCERVRDESKDEQEAIRKRLEYLYFAHQKLKKNRKAMHEFLPANTFRKKSNAMNLKKIQEIQNASQDV